LFEKYKDVFLQLAEEELKKKSKVDFDGDGIEHPAQYFEGLDEETARRREKEIERRQRHFKETGEQIYGKLPGDDEIDKSKQNKGTKSKKADKVREEIKKPGKDEFIRAASKVSGVSKKIIEEVYDKGLAAAATSGRRPGQTPQSWAKARVYAFLFDSKSGARKADNYLWQQHLENKRKAKKSSEFVAVIEPTPQELDYMEEAKQYYDDLYEEIDLRLNKSQTYIATKEVAEEAKRGLLAIEEHGSKAGTAVGRTRARQLADRKPLSYETVKRMKAFFDRHEKNKEVAEGKEWYEDNGFVSWLLWGGDAGRRFAERIIKEEEDKK